jgi:hypothetical protein
MNQMVQEALVFDYSSIDAAITGRTWIPAYCQFSDRRMFDAQGHSLGPVRQHTGGIIHRLI